MFLQCHNRTQQGSDHPLVANQSLQMAEFHPSSSMSLQRINPLSCSAMCRLPQTAEQSNAQSQPACPSAPGQNSSEGSECGHPHAIAQNKQENTSSAIPATQ